MKTIDQMTDEELIAEMREQGKRQGTVEYFMYSLLSTAHPNAIEMIEKQAVEMKKVGYTIGKEMSKAEDDPNRKAQILSTLEKAAQGFATPEDDDSIRDM